MGSTRLRSQQGAAESSEELVREEPRRCDVSTGCNWAGRKVGLGTACTRRYCRRFSLERGAGQAASFGVQLNENRDCW